MRRILSTAFVLVLMTAWFAFPDITQIPAVPPFLALGTGAAPAARLDIQTDGSANALIMRTDSTHYWCFNEFFNNTNPDLYMSPNSCASANSAVTFSANGNIGIGYASAGIPSKFAVNGALTATTATFTGSTQQVKTILAVSGLSTCNAAAEGTTSGVNDALAPSYLTTVSGGGSVHTPVYCNGTTWVAH